MSYFKNSYTANSSGLSAFLKDESKHPMVNKYYNITVASTSATLACSAMNYSLSCSWVGGSATLATHYADPICTGNMPNSGKIDYGEATLKETDVFTFFDGSVTNRAIAHWNDGTNDYTFHVYDSGTTHYASVATNNLDIGVTDTSFAFPVVKNFDLRTATNALNGGSDKYIIQPLIAFGMKTPIFLITGANGADVPLFSEIEAGGKSYFVIGSNYCVEM